MASASDLAAEISQLIPRVKRGSLVVFGDIFGGRIDNIHTVTAAKALGDPERLVVEFDEGETLEVWDPGNATISSWEFCISTATKARWEWFYYGLWVPGTVSHGLICGFAGTGAWAPAGCERWPYACST